MSIAKVIRRRQMLAQCMDQIMQSGGAERLFDHSLKFSPEVRDLLVAQERLLTAAERLLEHCQSGYEQAP